MHIVIDGRIINSTTGRYVERLVTYLQSVDTVNNYTVLVPSKDLSFWKPASDNFVVKAADFANYSFSEQVAFNTFLRKMKPDLVHFCMPQQPVLYRGKVVTTIHDFTLLETYMSDKNWLIYKLKQFVGYFVFKMVIKKSNWIITDAEYTKQKVLNFSTHAAHKTSAITLAADVVEGGAASYPTGFKKYILYVGQQSDYKNIKRLGDAHQELLEKYPGLGLVLVGRKNTSALNNKEYFAKKGYENILFTDFVGDDQLNWLYAHASAYVFPSLMEGFGLPGLEAMGHGTPVVSSNATCLPEIYGNAAHYFNPLDTHDIARAVTEVLEDDKLRTKLVTNGFKQIKKYSWKKMAKETHAIYMDILKD